MRLLFITSFSFFFSFPILLHQDLISLSASSSYISLVSLTVQSQYWWLPSEAAIMFWSKHQYPQKCGHLPLIGIPSKYLVNIQRKKKSLNIKYFFAKFHINLFLALSFSFPLPYLYVLFFSSFPLFSFVFNLI